MPAVALSRLAASSRPKDFATFLLDAALWRAASMAHGLNDALAPAYTNAGCLGGEVQPWQSELWTWCLSQLIASVESQLRESMARPLFDVELVKGARPRNTVLELHHGGGDVALGFVLKEEDMEKWAMSQRIRVLEP